MGKTEDQVEDENLNRMISGYVERLTHGAPTIESDYMEFYDSRVTPDLVRTMKAASMMRSLPHDPSQLNLNNRQLSVQDTMMRK